jgi:hypothetical protein
MANNVSVVNTEDKVCKPFALQVMVFSPESGYKFELLVERSCTVDKDEVWKLVFDLYRKDEGDDGFVQIVHVSFTAGETDESEGVQRMLSDGVAKKQSDVVVTEVHPAVKAIEGVQKPTTVQKARIHNAMRKAIVVDV